MSSVSMRNIFNSINNYYQEIEQNREEYNFEDIPSLKKSLKKYQDQINNISLTTEEIVTLKNQAQSKISETSVKIDDLQQKILKAIFPERELTDNDKNFVTVSLNIIGNFQNLNLNPFISTESWNTCNNAYTIYMRLNNNLNSLKNKVTDIKNLYEPYVERQQRNNI